MWLLYQTWLTEYLFSKSKAGGMISSLLDMYYYTFWEEGMQFFLFPFPSYF